MADRASLCLIYGVDPRGRSCAAVDRWLRRSLSGHPYFALSSVDPADGREVPARNRVLDAADAFIVVTPEYNHSFPAPLKALIDAARREWEAKPVAFVSYSGSASGGLRAVEHLRDVFGSLRAVSVREQVAIPNLRHAEAEAGTAPPSLDEAVLAQPFASMLRQLTWWTGVLMQARAHGPACRPDTPSVAEVEADAYATCVRLRQDRPGPEGKHSCASGR